MTAAIADPSATVRRAFAVVGRPIGHSLSPVLHRAAYRALGVTDARYTAHEVAEGSLGDFLESPAGRDLQGLSVTMPLKREAFGLARSRDAVSVELGVSNTLIRCADGTWHAENHDVHGIAQSLRDHGVDAAPARGGVIGSGATALSATAALLDLGVGEVVLTARSPHKLAPLAALARRRGAVVTIVPWDRADEVLAGPVVVSALAAAGAEALVSRMRTADGVPVPTTFLDVLYHPWPAPLAALLGEQGSDVASGLEMLVHQAAQQVRSMLGISDVPTDPMLEVGLAALAARR
ncbi:shikimate dehydrogenase family protein [Brachybacterium sp. AOP25-B2-12]|uniref:shikimate dehydrogenase family protein n=1 Tax=Brachybacterium sp. AOP25-B2-12 TaxID=3457710 RepID=UPI004034C797